MEQEKQQYGDMSMGDIIAAIEVLTSKAKHTWYISEPPYSGVKIFMETISALAQNAAGLSKGE